MIVGNRSRRTGSTSCVTSAMALRRDSSVISPAISCPSTGRRVCEVAIVKERRRRLKTVLFPAPEGPTSAILLAGRNIDRHSDSSAGASSVIGKVRHRLETTRRRLISPQAGADRTSGMDVRPIHNHGRFRPMTANDAVAGRDAFRKDRSRAGSAVRTGCCARQHGGQERNRMIDRQKVHYATSDSPR